MIFGKLFSDAVLSKSMVDAEEGSEGTRFISIGLCDDLLGRPHNVVVDEDDEELPQSVDVDDEDELIVDRRSLLVEFGRFRLRFEILEVILSLFTELGRDVKLDFLADPHRSIDDKSLPLPPPPLVVRNSSYGDSSTVAARCVSLTAFSDN